MPEYKIKNEPRILIVGGVAGGASFAARARRLSENAGIIMFDRGPHVSFANCGLPYYVGDVIAGEDDLIVTKPERIRDEFNIDLRLQNEVLSIDRNAKTVTVKDLVSGKEYREEYDALLLSAGSQPVKPKLPGIDLPGVFTLRSIPDSNLIKDWIKKRKVKNAVVVGGGLIGLEMTENLTGLGVSVTIVEMLPHVIPFFDPEMAVQLHDTLRGNGVNLRMGTSVTGFSSEEGTSRLSVSTDSGENLPCDMVILAIGSRPEADLARNAGLEIGELGGVRVNGRMQTSDENIYAVGDMVESRDVVTGEWTLTPLAGPANRQARIAADAVFGRDREFRGVQATSVCRVFGTVIASTGASEKTLKRYAGRGNIIPFEKVYLYPRNHPDYYPDSSFIAMKLLFSPGDGRVLGAQAVGGEGTEKRIDVISAVIQMGGTVYDLEEAELCYAPQVGSAREVDNMAGMTAANILRRDIPTTHWNDIDTGNVFMLDPRESKDYEKGHVEGAVNIPLAVLRNSLDKLDKDRKIYVYCNQGKSSYYACRILLQNGFDCVNLSGGYKTYRAWQELEKAD